MLCYLKVLAGVLDVAVLELYSVCLLDIRHGTCKQKQCNW